jgi:NADH/F420H2 dehydrogenase subunit C
MEKKEGLEVANGLHINLKEWSSDLGECLGNSVKKVEMQEVYQGVWETSVLVETQDVDKVAQFLRDYNGTQMEQLMDIVGVDYPEKEKRFEIIYYLLSVRWNQRITLKVQVNETERIPSLCGVYPNADWCEREVYDMNGVVFENHPDLRRILTDYGFQGHPIRKDFPCTGYTEVRYDELEKRVIVEEVEIAQEFRVFDYSSPWEQGGAFQQKEKRKTILIKEKTA